MATERGICAVAECARALTGRGEGHGMCGLHYQRWRKHGDVNHVRAGRNLCSIEGCTGLVVAHGWCSKHYTRWHRYGSPTFRMPGEIVNGKKMCRGCGEDKPVAEFSRLKDPCRLCQAAIRRAYRKANPDYWREPYDPVKQRARVAAWRAANPDKVRAACAARRARRLGAFVAVVSPRAIFDRDEWVCGICETAIDSALAYPDLMSASIDHIVPLVRGGTHEPANVQASHLLCNIRKGASELQEVV